MSPAGPNGGAPRDVRPPARPSAPRPIRVLLVDDHRLIPESLARVLGAEADIRIVGIAGSVAEAKELANAEPLDVVLMDYRLPDGTGVEATRAIKARWPSARVVMLTGVDDDETLLESIQAGADGYLTKDKALEDVVADRPRRVRRRDAPAAVGDRRRSRGAWRRPATARRSSCRSSS